MSECDVIEFSQIVIDNIIQVPFFPTPQNSTYALSDDYAPGGTVVNTVLWLANWGVRVRPAGSAIGTDWYGDLIINRLSALPSIDTRFIDRFEDVHTPIVRCLIVPSGERAFLAMTRVHPLPQYTITPRMLEGGRIFSFGQHAVNEAIPGLEHVREMGLVSAIGDIIHPDHPSLPLVDYAVNSADYVRVHFPGIDVYAHDRLVQRASGGVVVTTDSTHPIHVIDNDGSEFLVHPPVVEHVVDTTGAGDSFKAGFMYGLTHDLPLDHCVRIGSAAGSIQVQHMGATDYLAPIEDVLTLAETIRVTPVQDAY